MPNDITRPGAVCLYKIMQEKWVIIKSPKTSRASSRSQANLPTAREPTENSQVRQVARYNDVFVVAFSRPEETPATPNESTRTADCMLGVHAGK